MKNALFPLLAALTLGTAAQAQFTFSGFTGKTMKNAARPDVRIREKDTSGKRTTTQEHYFLWNRGFVKIQSVMFDQGKPNMVRESLYYYADFAPAVTTVGRSAATKSIECVLSTQGRSAVPTWENSDAYYSEAMRDLVSLTFETQQQGQAFLRKLTQQKRQSGAVPRRIVLKPVMKEKKS